MSDPHDKKLQEAVQEYVEAVDNYHRLLDKHFPLRRVVPGVEITPGEPITEAVLREFEEAEAKVTKTC